MEIYGIKVVSLRADIQLLDGPSAHVHLVIGVGGVFEKLSKPVSLK